MFLSNTYVRTYDESDELHDLGLSGVLYAENLSLTVYTQRETKHAQLICMCSPSPPCPSQVDDSTHTHLPNIETSSQLLEPDQSLTGRQEIDVTYAKVSKAQRKRRAAVAGSRPAPHSSIPVKCKRVELEEVFPMVQSMSGGGGGVQCVGPHSHYPRVVVSFWQRVGWRGNTFTVHYCVTPQVRMS